MCFSFFKPALVIEQIVVHPNSIRSILSRYNIQTPMGLLDSAYYTTDAETWAEVLSRLVQEPWAYKAETNDCDNIALEAMTTCSREYGLNTMGMAIGDIPSGRHAFNLFLVGNDIWVFEPQRIIGEQYFPLGQNGYTVDMVLI